MTEETQFQPIDLWQMRDAWELEMRSLAIRAEQPVESVKDQFAAAWNRAIRENSVGALN